MNLYDLVSCKNMRKNLKRNVSRNEKINIHVYMYNVNVKKERKWCNSWISDIIKTCYRNISNAHRIASLDYRTRRRNCYL